MREIPSGNEQMKALMPNPEIAQEEKEAESLARTLDYIGEYSETESPTGKEAEMISKTTAELDRLGIEYIVDEIGNIFIEGDKTRPESDVLLCAHTDKIGPGIKMTNDGETIQGRLDDGLGIGIIMGLLRDGYRPTVALTVREEGSVEKDGVAKGINDVKIWNEGAERIVDNIVAGKYSQPKTAIILEITGQDKTGTGPIMYQSAWTSYTKKFFPYPADKFENFYSNLTEFGIRPHHGAGNDALVFSMMDTRMKEKSPDYNQVTTVTALEVPIGEEDYHSNRERASIKDIDIVRRALKKILSRPELFR